MERQINLNILRELAKLKPNAYQYILRKYPQSNKWLLGETFPTYDQLSDLSKIFNVPLKYFFLSELPKHDYLPIHLDFTPSEELIDALKFAEKIQSWAKDISIELGYGKAEIYKLDLHTINRLFNAREITRLKTQNELFWYLIKKAEDKGVIVLVSGFIHGVDNNYRKLDIKEFKGFVLYDDIAPVIFINNNDSTTSKIHTLINGIIHTLIRESAILDKNSEDKFKELCDKYAEDILSFNRLAEEKDLDTQEPKIQFSERFLNLLRDAIYKGIISYRDALLITELKQL